MIKGDLDHVELGVLTGNHGDQNYDLLRSVDLNQYLAVAIYCERLHAVFGVAKLERFYAEKERRGPQGLNRFKGWEVDVAAEAPC